MDAEQKETILTECRELMAKAKYAEDKIEQFCGTVSAILQEIVDNPDEQREVRCKVIKRLDRIECRIEVSGDRIDPLSEGEGAEDRRFQDAVNHVLFNPETSISVSFTGGWNRLSIKSPSRIANSRLLNEPMVIAMLLGIVAGIICRFLPEEASSVFLNQIAAPIMSTIISLLMGVMGPVFFLFIIVSVSSLGSMEELAKVGKVIIKRFLLVSLWIAVLTTAVAPIFFPVLGAGGEAVDLPAVEEALLGIIPTGLISPFAEGQIPQVILLGLVFGVALLMMGEGGKKVRDALMKVKEWVMGVMVIMMKLLLAVPFISTMVIVANGQAALFIQGWKYIAAAYICFLLSLLIEFVAVSARCRFRIADLGKMLKQIAAMAFVTATPPTTMQLSYEVSAKDMGIDGSFTDLWLSLSYNLLSPSRTIALVLTVFFIADLTGTTVNVGMLVVMLIMVAMLSLASAGTTASSTVILKTLKLSPDMVGLFSAFEMFTRNAAAAYDVTYGMLEQLDAARETGKRGGDAAAPAADADSQ